MADLYYWDYLHLHELLSAQVPLSGREGIPRAHDEHFFIVAHQAFELWFKQVLFELDAVLVVMAQDPVAEREMGRVLARVERISAILRLLVEQLDVLETMTPLDFLDFRDALVPASGLQSVQFRLIENRLGLDRRQRVDIDNRPYTTFSRFASEHLAEIEASEAEPSLHDHVERWLARMPFVSVAGFDFLEVYRSAVGGYDAADGHFDELFDGEQWNELVRSGKRRWCHRAFVAALFINLYRDEPIFHIPFRFLTALADIDEGLTMWRHRHVVLVHRMIGRRPGTGGTTNRGQLVQAALRHRLFGDLSDIPSFLVPRSALPPLPPEVTRALDFVYRQGPETSTNDAPCPVGVGGLL